jgi:Glycosyltransferases involved in cell wall biogenesis
MDVSSLLKLLNVVVVVPTYNNDRYLETVIEALLALTSDVIVVNDGSTDTTADILQKQAGRLTLVSYPHNKGKGFALRTGFQKALALGFDYALTMDSDSQHKVANIVDFLNELEQHPGSLIVGSRLLQQPNMPERNTFANKFSNFWFRIQTGISFPDTQSGFRVYPLHALKKMRFITSRYETELEMLVRAAWEGIELRAIPIDVYYPPEGERISHFHPYRDFMRISLLNTVLTFAAMVYGYPKILSKKLI